MVPASGCSVQRVGTDTGSLLKDLPRHFPNLLIQVFWSVLVQLRQAEEILKISFHTEHVGQQNLENQGQKGWQLRTLKLTLNAKKHSLLPQSHLRQKSLAQKLHRSLQMHADQEQATQDL